MNKNYLLSFPRSGNSLVRYMVEYVTEKPTKDHDEVGYHKKFNTIRHKSNEIVLIKEHNHHNIKVSENTKLILIVRNFYDCIISHSLRSNFSVTQVKDYMNNLKFYDEFPNPKLLIYYEDIISDFESEFNKIINFIGEYNEEKLKDLCNNLDTHKDIVLKKYTNLTGSKTGGDLKIDLKSRFKMVDLEKIENIVNSEIYGDINNKYLKRYR